MTNQVNNLKETKPSVYVSENETKHERFTLGPSFRPTAKAAVEILQRIANEGIDVDQFENDDIEGIIIKYDESARLAQREIELMAEVERLNNVMKAHQIMPQGKAWSPQMIALEATTKDLLTALETSSEKLKLYRAQNSGEYVGGLEYTELQRRNKAAIERARSQS